MEEMSNTKPIAHVSEDRRIHLLDEHLRETEKLAERFAAEFGCGDRCNNYYERRDYKA